MPASELLGRLSALSRLTRLTSLTVEGRSRAGQGGPEGWGASARDVLLALPRGAPLIEVGRGEGEGFFGDQGTSSWLWDFLPGRTWAEILSFLWPDMGSRISGHFFPVVDCLACAAATGKAGGAVGAPLQGKLWACVTCALHLSSLPEGSGSLSDRPHSPAQVSGLYCWQAWPTGAHGTHSRGQGLGTHGTW
jgi:hypothetical protein